MLLSHLSLHCGNNFFFPFSSSLQKFIAHDKSYFLPALVFTDLLFFLLLLLLRADLLGYKIHVLYK